jgi:hypothetical protein
VNLNRSAPATESALQLATKLKVDILLIQEPWIISEENNTINRLISYTSFIQIIPLSLLVRLRILAYISKEYKASVTLAPTNIDPDLLVLVVAENNNTIKLVNIYNETSLIEGNLFKTIERALLLRVISAKSVILDDFNIYYL